MSKYSNKEALYARMRELGNVNEGVKQELNALGTLIDFKRGADQVAYGIVKENHHYFIKKSNKQTDPNVEDFAYVGGLGNIHEHRYNKLSEADKNRNMLLITINEALNGGKPVIAEEEVAEKQTLNEEKGKKPTFEKGVKPDFGKGEKEDDKDAEKDDEKEEKKEEKEEKEDDKDAEKDDKKEEKKDYSKKWNFEKKKDDVDEGVADELAAAEEKLAGAEEKAVEPVAEPEAGLDVDAIDLPAEEPAAEVPAEEPAAEVPAPEVELDAEIGPEGDAEVSVDAEVPAEVPAGDLAVGDEGGADLDEIKAVESAIGTAGEMVQNLSLEQDQISTFISTFLGYFKNDLIEKFDETQREALAKETITGVEQDPDVAAAELEKVDVGAEEEANMELEGVEKSCDECGFARYAESRGYNAESIMECSIDEMASLMNGYGLQQEGEINEEDLESMAIFATPEVSECLKEEYANEELTECMQPFTKKINEVEDTSKSKSDTVKGMFWWMIKPQEKKDVTLKTLSEEEVAEGMNGTDPLNTVVQPPEMIKEDDEVEVEKDDDAVEEPVLDLTKREEPELEMGAGFETMGAGTAKPDGAPMTTVEVDGKEGTVQVTMNESERKLRKYIRARLEENAGLRKPLLNEDKKSNKIKQLDKMIDSQVELFESILKEGGFGDKLAGAMGKASQWMEGDLKKQKALRAALPSLTSGEAVNKWFAETFKNKMDGQTQKYAARTSADQKLAMLQQAAQDKGGLGKIKPGKEGVVYVPTAHSASDGPSGFALGRSRLGEEK